MQRAVALTSMWTCASSPSPASLPDTVRLSSERVTVTVFETKCGLPAHTAGTAKAVIANVSPAKSKIRRMRTSFVAERRFFPAGSGRAMGRLIPIRFSPGTGPLGTAGRGWVAPPPPHRKFRRLRVDVDRAGVVPGPQVGARGAPVTVQAGGDLA